MSEHESDHDGLTLLPLEKGDTVKTYVQVQLPNLSLQLVNLQTMTVPPKGAQLYLFAEYQDDTSDFKGSVRVGGYPRKPDGLPVLLLEDNKAEYVQVTNTAGQTRVFMFFEQEGVWSILPWYEARQQEQEERIGELT